MTKEEFTSRFSTAVEDLDRGEVCRRLKLSGPTFDRWVEGNSAPHDLGREPALALVAQMREEMQGS